MDWWDASWVTPAWVLPPAYALAAAASRPALVAGVQPRAAVILLEVDARAPGGASA